ncbi:MAG: Gldg family protein [Cyanobacteria bacterium REEB459]|nr:Gldg family protein [Cyanobacteria bacterium REEB459]
MKIAIQKSLKYLVWPGLALLTAALVVGWLQGWSPLPLGLLLAGGAMVGLGLGFRTAGDRHFWQQRATLVGANALVSTLAVLAILALLNVLAVRHSSRFDLTENQIFTLAPQSQQVIKALAMPTKVVIFDPNPNPQDRQLLESYRRAGERFTFEYVNPAENPRLAQEFGVTQAGAVFLQQGEQRRLLQTLTASDRLSERTLTNALDQVAHQGGLRAYFTQGHRELPIDGSKTGFSQAARALKDKGFQVETLDLSTTTEIPEDGTVVIVAGPSAQFFEREVETLIKYGDRGGSLLLMIDPRTSPNLDRLLDGWGISLDRRIVLDTSGAGQLVGLGPAAPLVTDYGDHPITHDFGQGRSFFPLVRPVNLEPVAGVTAQPILRSKAQSRAEALSSQGELKLDQNAPPAGPYTLGVALQRSIQPGGSKDQPGEGKEDQPQARLVVIGNSSFATDGLFEQQLNGDVFLNAVSWLGKKDDATLSIRPRQVINRRLVMTVQQQIGLVILALLGLPLVGFGLALVIWLKRR